MGLNYLSWENVCFKWEAHAYHNYMHLTGHELLILSTLSQAVSCLPLLEVEQCQLGRKSSTPPRAASFHPRPL